MIFTFSWLTLALSGMIPKSHTLEQAQSQNSKQTQKKNISPLKMLDEARFKAQSSFHRKEQQRAKMSFRPKPIWSDQTEKCSGHRGHTHPQMLWLPVELSTSRHEPLLTASWGLQLWRLKQDLYSLATLLFRYQSVCVHPHQYKWPFVVPDNMIKESIVWSIQCQATVQKQFPRACSDIFK